MKTTGVTRRIDELGRIVIPKEIRRMLSIRDGESLEILVDNDKIILKKFLVMDSLKELSEKLIAIYSSVSDRNIIITDREKVVVTSSGLEKYVGELIGVNLIKLIDNRESSLNGETTRIDFENIGLDGKFSIVPIINEIDCVGLVIIDNSKYNGEDLISKIIAKILSEKININ